MTTVRLDFESVATVEGERHLIVIAWDVATDRPVTTGRLATVAAWLDDRGYKWITGTNGRWSDE